MMEIMGTAEYEAETISLALAGDAEAGREALLLCRNQLAMRTLSPLLADYLAARLNDVLDGIRPDRALCIAKGPGKPADSLPKWKQHLGAFAAVLTQRGYSPQKIADAMCDARATVSDKSLENSDAHKIRTLLVPLQQWEIRYLLDLTGPYRKLLLEYPPLK